MRSNGPRSARAGIRRPWRRASQISRSFFSSGRLKASVGSSLIPASLLHGTMSCGRVMRGSVKTRLSILCHCSKAPVCACTEPCGYNGIQSLTRAFECPVRRTPAAFARRTMSAVPRPPGNANDQIGTVLVEQSDRLSLSVSRAIAPCPARRMAFSLSPTIQSRPFAKPRPVVVGACDIAVVALCSQPHVSHDEWSMQNSSVLVRLASRAPKL